MCSVCLRAVGGEVGATSSLAPKIGPLGLVSFEIDLYGYARLVSSPDPPVCKKREGGSRISFVPRPGRRRKEFLVPIARHVPTTPRKPGVPRMTVRFFALLSSLGCEAISYRCSLVP